MDMLTPVLQRLRAANEADLSRIAKATGVPRPTIAKIKYGQTLDPRILTVQKLYTHLVELRPNARRVR